MKLRHSLIASLVMLGGVSIAGIARATTTAVFNSATQMVTVTGIAETQTFTTTAANAGSFTYATENAAFGTVTLDLQCAGTISIKCGDAILGEVPSGWSFAGGTYAAEISGWTGNVLSFAETGYTTDPGFVSLLGEADRDFTTLDYLQTTAEYSVSGNPVGVVLKGILVARAAYTCSGSPVVTIGTLSTQPALNFTQISDTNSTYSTVVTAPPATPAVPPWGTGMLAALLAGTALTLSRRTRA